MSDELEQRTEERGAAERRAGERGTAVLFSAGLDSAVLAASEAQHGPVWPVYVSVGLAWEGAERATAARLLATPLYQGRVRPLATLTFTMADIYPSSHWAIRGVPPAYDTPDEDVYLIGRNLVLLTKAGTWCVANKVSRIVLGPLAGNPFPDATPEFFASMASALSLGLAHPIEIATPFRQLHKDEVVRRGAGLGVPFEHTLSCMNPKLGPGAAVAYLHCGACSKCRERLDAFKAAGVTDPAPYAG
jgi:7-cyano-7-deazaguanine synthase